MKIICPILIASCLIWNTFTLSGQVLDSTFGVPGSFAGLPGSYFPGTTAPDFVGRADQAFSTLHLDDGKIMLAGYTRGSDGNDFALVRLMPNGEYDETAGPEGEIRLDLGFYNDSCLVAVRYNNEDILMGGCVSLPGQNKYVNLLVRTDLNGQIDSFFGDNGKVIIDLPSEYEMITEIRIQSDNKIIIAGNAFYKELPFPDSTVIFIGRLLPNGQTDSSFGENGFVYRRYESYCNSSLLGDLVLDKNDLIIASGGSYDPYPGSYDGSNWCTHNIHIFRFLPDGQPDPAFGSDGVVELPLTEGRATALYVEDDEKILVAGVISDLLISPVYTFLTRLLPDGTTDSAFAVNGRFIKFILGGGGGVEPIGLVRIKEKIVMGTVNEPNGDHDGFGALFLTREGEIDLSFGDQNVFTYYPDGPLRNYANNISTIDSQHIFIGGYYRILEPNNMMICKIKIDQASVSSTAYSSKQIKFYPNPVDGQAFYLDLPEDEKPENLFLNVFNVNGRTVLSLKPGAIEANQEIPVPGLMNGIYFMELAGENTHYIGKLVINKYH